MIVWLPRKKGRERERKENSESSAKSVYKQIWLTPDISHLVCWRVFFTGKQSNLREQDSSFVLFCFFMFSLNFLGIQTEDTSITVGCRASETVKIWRVLRYGTETVRFEGNKKSKSGGRQTNTLKRCVEVSVCKR